MCDIGSVAFVLTNHSRLLRYPFERSSSTRKECAGVHRHFFVLYSCLPRGIHGFCFLLLTDCNCQTPDVWLALCFRIFDASSLFARQPSAFLLMASPGSSQWPKSTAARLTRCGWHKMLEVFYSFWASSSNSDATLILVARRQKVNPVAGSVLNVLWRTPTGLTPTSLLMT